MDNVENPILFMTYIDNAVQNMIYVLITDFREYIIYFKKLK